ncbi:hypothetical protein SKAU_G00164950 [Synaphobranchus kaupii]|uniref:Uncharacterized protein n=1 Tax=Synaphobranchus kaupii TaxID=118154 RepID=A0A9Q1J046_SYNKA|nr:hypothetical protein SKAU_G00164950 [Synaphobranchus kaupii]
MAAFESRGSCANREVSSPAEGQTCLFGGPQNCICGFHSVKGIGRSALMESVQGTSGGSIPSARLCPTQMNSSSTAVDCGSISRPCHN